MDKITESIHNMLFDAFGLCPEYEIVRTEAEWIEFYAAPEPPFWAKYNPQSYVYPDKVRIHLDEHQVKLSNGNCVVAYFAVHHRMKRIYLQIIKITGGDAYCKVYKNV